MIEGIGKVRRPIAGDSTSRSGGLLIEAMTVGDRGLLIETDLPPAWLADAIGRARLPSVIDIVPGACTVLVITEPGAAAHVDVAARIAALPVDEPASAAQPAIEIPVCYDGPDLDAVAGLACLSVAELIARHAGALYTVGWLGFSPGFGYLTGLDPRLAGVGRLETPRLAVPVGAVAIAAGLAAVYPSASPGGWRLLGSTTLRMWDQDREPAALLAPGRHVRFTPVRPSAGRLSAGLLRPAQPRETPSGRPEPTAWLEVTRPGPLATVQDLGRSGFGAIGVPPSGAADPASLVAANRLVGNRDGAAGVELTLGRAAFRCHGDLTFAVTGAPAPVTLSVSWDCVPSDSVPSDSVPSDSVPSDSSPAPADPDADGPPAPPPGGGTHQVALGTRTLAPDGAVISVGAPESGLRTYLAVTGGIAVPLVLGSRSSDLLSGLGGGRLATGDTLPIGSDIADSRPFPEPGAAGPPGPEPGPGRDVARAGTRVLNPGDSAVLRVIGGPRLDWFEADALDTLCAGTYTVTPASNRTGLRLDGQPLRRRRGAELPSEGMVTGSLQVPPDGMPILLLADHPTVGGYPVIAVVADSDIGRAAQLRPGDRIEFSAVTALSPPRP